MAGRLKAGTERRRLSLDSGFIILTLYGRFALYAENGFTAARDALGKKTRINPEEIKYIDPIFCWNNAISHANALRKNPAKHGYLLSAIQCYEEYLLSKVKASDERKLERAIEEELVNPKVFGKNIRARESTLANFRCRAEQPNQLKSVSQPKLNPYSIPNSCFKEDIYLGKSQIKRDRCPFLPSRRICERRSRFRSYNSGFTF